MSKKKGSPLTEDSAAPLAALETALKDFKRSVEITRDVRFQANLRLAKRQLFSSYIVSILSLFVIVLSLLPNILILAPTQNQILLACSICLSVFVIFTSLLDGAQNFHYKGELLHQCARKVATIYLELKNIDPHVAGADVEFKRLQIEYQRALDDCPINHENIDFIREQAYKPHLFPVNFSQYGFIKDLQVRWRSFQGFIGANSWMLPHLVAMGVVSAVVYFFVLPI